MQAVSCNGWTVNGYKAWTESEGMEISQPGESSQYGSRWYDVCWGLLRAVVPALVLGHGCFQDSPQIWQAIDGLRNIEAEKYSRSCGFSDEFVILGYLHYRGHGRWRTKLSQHSLPWWRHIKAVWNGSQCDDKVTWLKRSWLMRWGKRRVGQTEEGREGHFPQAPLML